MADHDNIYDDEVINRLAYFLWNFRFPFVLSLFWENTENMYLFDVGKLCVYLLYRSETGKFDFAIYN